MVKAGSWGGDPDILARGGVGLAVLGSWYVWQRKVKSYEKERPLSLPGIQPLSWLEIVVWRRMHRGVSCHRWQISARGQLQLLSQRYPPQRWTVKRGQGEPELAQRWSALSPEKKPSLHQETTGTWVWRMLTGAGWMQWNYNFWLKWEKNEYFFQINKDKLIEHVTQDIVHQVLENSSESLPVHKHKLTESFQKSTSLSPLS